MWNGTAEWKQRKKGSERGKNNVLWNERRKKKNEKMKLARKEGGAEFIITDGKKRKWKEEHWEGEVEKDEERGREYHFI